MEPAIHADRLSRHYLIPGEPGGLWALKDVSFSVAPGEIAAIVGANGSGKSTLFRILAGITEPSAGRARIVGRLGSLLEMGTGFHPDLTGRENVYLNGSILGMTRREIDGKFDRIVAFSEVGRFLDLPVKRYSSGMYVRLAFAVAAHLEPDILLVDEVLAVGDASFQRKCLRTMSESASRGTTVLFITHDPRTVRALCSRALLLAGGRLEGDGPCGEMLSRYEGKSREVDRAFEAEGGGGDFDLTDHPARPPGCPPILRRLTLSSGSDRPTGRFVTGESFRLDLAIEPPAPIPSARAAVAIEDATGRRIATLASFFSPDPLGTLGPGSRIRCALDRLELAPGRYLLSLGLWDQDGAVQDALENAVAFEVTGRDDLLPAGEPWLPIFGPVLIRSTWTRGTPDSCSGPTRSGT